MFIDELVRYADLYRNDQMDAETSLFGDIEEMRPVRPEMPEFTGEENILDTLQKEKDCVGMYLSSHPLDRYSFEIENFTTCQLAGINERVGECEMAKTICKESLAGMVTEVKTMTTKSGSPGARVTLEDFSGTYEFALFGKDYESYLPFMKLHESLFIEGEINERYYVKPEDRAKGKTSPYGFKIKKITLLGNVGLSRINKFAIFVGTDNMGAEFRKTLAKVLKTHKGSTPLTIYIHDEATGYKLEFFSKKYQVAVNQELISDLQLLGLQYKVIAS